MSNKRLLAFIGTASPLVFGSNTVAMAQQSDTDRIAISDLKEKLDSGETFLLIDVREDYELEEDGAIEGAIHIPVAELDARMKDIPKDIELVFY